MAKGGAIGIDLGSSLAKVAAVKSGGVDIITNELSNRMTPVVVGFGEKERFLGE
jgi:molecular chaperone DnaK (HSP70)